MLKTSKYHLVIRSFYPTNYRFITLINCIAKLFTFILNNRLQKYVELFNLIPEFQSGFRKCRGCVDNIFILNSIIQIHTNIKGHTVYGTFVDFRKAFDTIDHQILFAKLQKMRISAKFINIISNFYQKASTFIEVKWW